MSGKLSTGSGQTPSTRNVDSPEKHEVSKRAAPAAKEVAQKTATKHQDGLKGEEGKESEKSKQVDVAGEDFLAPEFREAALKRIEALSEQAQHQGWYGAWTLFRREIARFWSIAGQTIISPVLTTMLYFLVFGYSLEDRLGSIDGANYIDFLVPGLVMLAMISNAYINAAFSLFIGKIQGNIVDLLVTPLTYVQWLAAFSAASVLRAMLIGGIIWGVAMAMGAYGWHNVPLTLLFMVLTGLAFSIVGVMVAILATDFDHVNLIPNFLITPLTFLGGVFYSIDMLPEPWRTVSLFNPILYMVNGLRAGMIGQSDVPFWQGLVVLGGLIGVFGAATIWLLKTGKKLRE